MNENKLKPCPFCGGEASVEVGEEVHSFESMYPYKLFMAECRICGASTMLFETEEKARDAWNERTNNV